MAPPEYLGSSIANRKESASKRKRINRLAKLRQCKLDAQRKQWQPHEGTEQKEGQKILITDITASIDNPGEVINAEIQTFPPTDSPVTWASLLNSNASSTMHQKSQSIQSSAKFCLSESEPDPDLLSANSNLQADFPVNRSHRSLQKSIWSDKSRELTCNACCEDRRPKGKLMKVGKGSRSSGGPCRHSKENLCIENLQIAGRHRQFDVKHQNQDHSDDAWEAAASALGLHTSQKIFSNILRPQVVFFNNCEHANTKSIPLLRSKPKQPLQNFHGRSKAQEDSHGPPLLSRTKKQQYPGMKMLPRTRLNDASEKPQCLVCTEDLDITDTSFEGCECGFNICLFCYHKIAQESGKCPGCRGIYKQDVSAKPVCLLPR